MDSLPENIGMFAGTDGASIFYRHYAASDERARLVIAHGLGEHSGRYGNVIERLIPMGISIWVPDHRGHGRSDGKRGQVLNFIQYLMDLNSMIERVKADLAGEHPCFLLGHSMGGLIALYFAQQFPDRIDGVLVSSPALGMIVEVPAVKKAFGYCMSYLWPSLTLANDLDEIKISHDQKVVRDYQNDPLVHDRVSTRFFTEFLAAMETVNQQASSLRVPLLMQVAGTDHLVDSRASERFFAELKMTDKTLRVYAGMYNEIYYESEEQRDWVLQDLADWLQERI